MSFHHYQLCGWHVRSGIALPELPPWPAAVVAPEDISIEEGPVPDRLDAGMQEPSWLEVGGNGAVLMQIPDLVRIHVQDGRNIRVQRLRPDDAGWRLFLLGSALAYLCLQRGLFPLHAACLRMGTRTLAIAGHGGAGKSTLAAVLLRRGHGLLGDDLTVLDVVGGGGRIEVLPAFPRLKLWREAMDALRIPGEGAPRVREGMDKYDLRPQAGFDPAPAPLCAVLVLREGPEVALQRLSPAAAVPALHGHLARPRVAARMGLRDSLFGQAASIGRVVPVWTLQRPRSFDALDATADLVEAHFRT
ncbi:hypothetical protein M5C97_05510 [Acidovorax sp. NCPPB 3859]|nr:MULTISPECIES: hypothetical protein [unclassified Acidovorax]MDA8448677.1 hypothetical protein [Acidovorax sp. GBBC 3297]MDA8458204.1 hypothetical protein [Acidovorax sp. GBBC 3333]MDA8463242.1 hypothetical protein [Acidovorax sp. GBBC 3332]MDA8468153.1 hypothetical protein [Acidovorax sp. GBBC 3299]WCM79761.1 hypothetical protein M5C94_05505 [Acidovorax sp. GBBC 712]